MSQVKRWITLTAVFLLYVLILSSFFTSALGADPVIWATNSRVDLLKGDAKGVSISDAGIITLAPKLEQLFNTGQPYVWSSAIDSTGNVYLGTGHDGKIFKVTPAGAGSLVYDSAELDVTALAFAPDGTLFAGTSPDGKVYRIANDGQAEVYFDPPDKYIWSLAVMKDGSLAVGTGDSGKLYRVRGKDAKAENSLLVDTTQTHVISLAVDAQGNLVAGTDPGGIVLRVSPEGKAFALFDSSLREIHGLAPAPDGSIYALGLSDNAAGPKAAQTPAPVSAGDAGAAGAGTGTVTATVTLTSGEDGATPGQAATPARSRNDLSNAKSAVFRILPDGSTDVLWNSSTITAFSIVANPFTPGVLIGTADKGRVYTVSNDGRDTLMLQSPEGQISVLTSNGKEVMAGSSNQGKLFRFGPRLEQDGTFESSVRDAKLVSSWGRIWWRGFGQVQLQTRSGNTERPDATWSEWSRPYTDGQGAAVNSPKARFIQWRAVLRGTTQSEAPRIESVNLAYMPRNVAPEIVSITFLPPGVGLQQAISVPVDPNIESSGLDPTLFGAPPTVPPRRIFQRGARSVQWQAEDRNGDTMEYSLYCRGVNDSEFRLLKDRIRDTFFTIDGATLADGRYVFKVVASDAPDNPAGQALKGERVSEPVEIDTTPPDIKEVGAPRIVDGRVTVAFDAIDATGLIKKADMSLDAGSWSPVLPDDHIADSSHETYSLSLPVASGGEHTVSIRVFDSSGNVASARVTVRE
jgi:hypothetical protein